MEDVYQERSSGMFVWDVNISHLGIHIPDINILDVYIPDWFPRWTLER